MEEKSLKVNIPPWGQCHYFKIPRITYFFYALAGNESFYFAHFIFDKEIIQGALERRLGPRKRWMFPFRRWRADKPAVEWPCLWLFLRWVREFLNEDNKGLDVLVEYLSFAQYAVTWVTRSPSLSISTISAVRLHDAPAAPCQKHWVTGPRCWLTGTAYDTNHWRLFIDPLCDYQSVSRSLLRAREPHFNTCYYGLSTLWMVSCNSVLTMVALKNSWKQAS